MRIAIFTGAGASYAIGYPLTSHFLPRVRDELKTGVLFKNTNSRAVDNQERKDLRRYLPGLLPGFWKLPDEELPLITELFSVVEHALSSGESLPIGGESALLRCRDLLKHAIADVLLGDFMQPWNEKDREQKLQQQTLKRFAAWTLAQKDRLGPRRPAITLVQRGDAERSRYKALFPNCTYRKDGLGAFLEAEAA
jgi:hypothetical protein